MTTSPIKETGEGRSKIVEDLREERDIYVFEQTQRYIEREESEDEKSTTKLWSNGESRMSRLVQRRLLGPTGWRLYLS